MHLEQHSTMQPPDVCHILSFCFSQFVFGARQNMYRVSVIRRISCVGGNSGVPVQGVSDFSEKCSDRARAHQSFLPFCRGR